MLRYFLAFSLPVVSSAALAQDLQNWSGSVELRGNYYLERSTRVMAPAVQGRFESPDGLMVQADYLVDAITSASLATGVVSDKAFTEIRHDLGTLVSGELLLSGVPVRFRGGARISYEPDYFSKSISFGASVALLNRATVIDTQVSFMMDNVGKILRGIAIAGSNNVTDSAREHVGDLFGISLNTSISHALSPNWLISAGYDIAALSGFLANPYRTVAVEGTPRSETHPGRRTRHTWYATAAYFIDDIDAALHLSPSLYADNWSILGKSMELRYYQLFSEAVSMRAKARAYWQSEAYFYKPVADYSASDRYFTADPKMSDFQTWLLGLQLVFNLSFLEHSFLHFIHPGRFDISVERFWNTNRFGPGVIAQSGLWLPF